MNERMLDKSVMPDMAAMTAVCSENADLFTHLNEWLASSFALEQKIVFPYGSKYGWAISHRKKSKLFCNVFPEHGAFTVMAHLSERQFQSAFTQLSVYARQHVDNQYPCGDGSWIHFRVTCPAHLTDIETLLTAKMQKNTATKKGGK